MKDNKNVMWQFSTVNATFREFVNDVIRDKTTCSCTGIYKYQRVRTGINVDHMCVCCCFSPDIIMCAHNYKCVSNNRNKLPKNCLTTFFSYILYDCIQVVFSKYIDEFLVFRMEFKYIKKICSEITKLANVRKI